MRAELRVLRARNSLLTMELRDRQTNTHGNTKSKLVAAATATAAGRVPSNSLPIQLPLPESEQQHSDNIVSPRLSELTLDDSAQRRELSPSRLPVPKWGSSLAVATTVPPPAAAAGATSPRRGV